MMRRAFFLGIALFVACCGGNPQNASSEQAGMEESAAPASGGECLVGTWTMVEGGVPKTFSFRADASGEEVQAPDDVRPFTWSIQEEGKVHIVYTPHDDVVSSAWDLDLDCGANALSFFGARYSK